MKVPNAHLVASLATLTARLREAAATIATRATPPATPAT